MATSPPLTPQRLEPPLESLLARLRRRIRAYVWADGVAAALVVLGAGFWLSLALDWLIEPPVPLRVAVLLAMVGTLGYVLVRLLADRLRVRLTDRSMALLLERRFASFQDSLLTVVELSDQDCVASEFNPEMLRQTRRQALAGASHVDLSAVFNTRPLVRRVSLAAFLVLATGVFVIAFPSAAGVWARRSLLMSQELWPRRTHLLVQGMDDKGAVKIARGADWQLTVQAEAALGREIPEIVEVRYGTSEGVRGRENMSRDGIVLPGQAPFQNYTYTFKSVLSPLDFYVYGGDDRAGPFHLELVDSPTITLTLHCEYPTYMEREPRDIPAAGAMQVPRGTQVTILAEANKPLVGVQIDDVADENTPVTHQLDLTQNNTPPQTNFRFALQPLERDKTLLFTLRDADGIRSREAMRLSISVVPDEAPLVNVQLKGVGSAITPQARLLAAGDVTDDYALQRLWFDFHVDDQPARQQAISSAAEGKEKVTLAEAFEVRDLALEPKQKLHWSVQAADRCDLEGGPNQGASQRYVLDVVTPEQLRAMLEARELELRRRFETIIDEATDTRNLLAGVTPGKAEGASPQLVQLERVVQNSKRSAHETAEVAGSFDEIREEMINNRIDTEELKTRLKDGVADPLRKIVSERFPKFDAALVELTAKMADPQQAEAPKAAAVAQADAILVEMKQVLDKMLELETFNEVLDMLRQIIGAQEKINDETKAKQKSKLRDLLE